MKKKKLINYAPNTYRPDVSYGVRKWQSDENGQGIWLYYCQKFSKNNGWKDGWSDNERKAYTTTGILTAMFWAQEFAYKTKECIDVIMVEDPKTVWSTHYKNANLELESKEARENRLKI